MSDPGKLAKSTAERKGKVRGSACGVGAAGVMRISALCEVLSIAAGDGVNPPAATNGAERTVQEAAIFGRPRWWRLLDKGV